MVTNLDKKMLTGFSREVRSYLPSIRDGIEGYRHDASQREGLEEALRYIHTIKGASALMGLSALSRLTTCVQELLEDVMGAEIPMAEAEGAWLIDTMDQVEPYLNDLLEGSGADEGFLNKIEQTYSALKGEPGVEGTESVDLSPVGDESVDTPEPSAALDEANATEASYEAPLDHEAAEAMVTDMASADAWEDLGDEATVMETSTLPEADDEEDVEGEGDAGFIQSQDISESGEVGAIDSQRGVDGDFVTDDVTASEYEDMLSQDHDALSSDEPPAVVSESMSGVDSDTEEETHPVSESSEPFWADGDGSEEVTDISEAIHDLDASGMVHDGYEQVEVTGFIEPSDDENLRDVEDSDWQTESSTLLGADNLSAVTDDEESVAESGELDTELQDEADASALLPDVADDEFPFGYNEAATSGWAHEGPSDVAEAQEPEPDDALSRGVETFSLPEAIGDDIESFAAAGALQDETSGLTEPEGQEAAEVIPAQAGALDDLVESIDHEVSTVYHNEALSASRRSSLAYLSAAERYVMFVIGQSLYAVSVTNLLEIGRVPRITPVPNVPMWVPGVINLRGEILSVIDLRTFLGIEDTSQVDDSRMLVVKTAADEVTTSLVVDEVRGFMRLDTEKMATATMPLDDWVAPYLTGVFEHEEEVIAVMDLERFLLSPEICQFD